MIAGIGFVIALIILVCVYDSDMDYDLTRFVCMASLVLNMAFLMAEWVGKI